MNEIENQLLVLIKKAMEVAESTGEFVIDQAPLLLQEFYDWRTASHILLSCLFVVPLCFFIYFYRTAEWEYVDSFREVMSIVFGIASAVMLILAIINIYQLVFIYTAPKLYLIEYFIK